MFLGNSELACLNLTFTGHSKPISLFVTVKENSLHMSSAPSFHSLWTGTPRQLAYDGGGRGRVLR